MMSANNNQTQNIQNQQQQLEECLTYLKSAGGMEITCASNPNITVSLNCRDYLSAINYSPIQTTLNEITSKLLNNYLDIFPQLAQRDAHYLGRTATDGMQSLREYIKNCLTEQARKYVERVRLTAQRNSNVNNANRLLTTDIRSQPNNWFFRF